MNNKNFSNPNIPTLKHSPIQPNSIYADKNNYSVFKTDNDYKRNVSNSYQLYYNTYKRFHPNYGITSVTNSFSPEYNNYTRAKTIDNKNEFSNEDIKKIFEVIEDIKEYQKELISVIKDLKINHQKNINDEKKIEQKKEEERKKENTKDKEVENKLFSSINKLKEDYESMREELSILKQKDEENKKIIESNQKEIEILKKSINTNSYEKNEIIIEKDKRINQLEESFEKMENEKLDLSEKLLNKNSEIINLKRELEDYKTRSTNNNFETKKICDKLNNLSHNVELIKDSMPNINTSSNINILTKSRSLDVEPIISINCKNGKYIAENKND